MPPAVHHVSPTGNDNNIGSAGSPYLTIGKALSVAGAGDTIKVAAGTYTAASFSPPVQVILLGGYNSSFTARDLHLNKSILRASGNGFVDNQSSTLDGFVLDGVTAGQGVDAISVTGGDAVIAHNLIINYTQHGQTGIYVGSGAGAMIRNNILYRNQLSGGGTVFYGIYLTSTADSVTTRVHNNIIAYNDYAFTNSLARSIADYNLIFGNFDNYDGMHGVPGAHDVNSDPKFIYPDGGDFRLKASSPAVDAGNPADDFSSEPSPNGGRINMGHLGGTAQATRSGINPSTYVSKSGNDANDGSLASPYLTIQTALQRALGDTIKVAAGTYSEGLITASAGVLRGGYDNTFGESARSPGANPTRINGVSSKVYYDAFGVHVDGFEFDGGTTVSEYGLHLTAACKISHCVIKNVRFQFGYGVYVDQAGVEFVNNTVYSCDYGVYIPSGSGGVSVRNNIFSGNSFAIVNNQANGIAAYNDFYNNGTSYGGSFTSPGTGDIALNPLFENPGAGLFTLQNASPCINAGDPNVLYNDPDGSRNDMGAYYYINYPPQGTSALFGAPRDGGLYLRWPKNLESDIARYRIYLGTSSNPVTQVDSSSGASDTLRIVGGLTNGTRYYARIATVDNSGLFSGYSNEISAVPNSAPANPLIVSATPSSGQIGLIWRKNLESDFLRYRVFRSTVSPPSVQNDSTGGGANDTTRNYSGLTNGVTYYFRVVAVDSSMIYSGYSNELSATPSSVTAPSLDALSLDVTPNPVAPGLTVSVTITVNGSSPTVKLFSGKNSESATDSVLMTLSSGQYSGTIAGQKVSSDGTWFRIRAGNTAGRAWYPSETGKAAINVQLNSFSSVVSAGEYPSGVESNDYYTFALPFNATIPFGQILPTQKFNAQNQPTNWRIQTVVSGNIVDAAGGQLEFGKAYFLQHRLSSNVNLVSGLSSATTGNANAFLDYMLPAGPGWSLVPWPHTFSANVTVTDNSKIGSVWRRNGPNYWEPVTVLKPFGGYAIYNKTASIVRLGDALSISLSKPARGWPDEIVVSASAGKYKDSYNRILLAPDAGDGLDDNDEPEPLAVDQKLALHLKPPDGDDRTKLSTDARSFSGEGHAWEFVLKNETGHDGLLRFHRNGFANLKLLLVNVAENRFFELGETEQTIATKTGGRFLLFAGTEAFVQGQKDAVEKQLPKRFGLRQNFPNPFNPSTNIPFDIARSSQATLSIYNMLGQKIRTIAEGFFETGSYERSWDGRDDRGQSVSSGIYFYRLQAGGFTIARRMLLTK